MIATQNAFVLLLKELVKDPSKAEDIFFQDVLNAAAVDFYNFVQRFNAGNGQGNLRRVGSKLTAILECCREPTNVDIRWDLLYADVLVLTDVAEFDFDNNTEVRRPHHRNFCRYEKNGG